MSKKPEELTDQLDEAFSKWNDAVDTLIEQANAGFMPLLAKVFILAKEVLNMYEKAFTEGIKKQKENKKE